MNDDFEKMYRNELALFYGDKEKLAENLKVRIKRYSVAPSTPKVRERVNLLKRTLEMAERSEINET